MKPSSLVLIRDVTTVLDTHGADNPASVHRGKPRYQSPGGKKRGPRWALSTNYSRPSEVDSGVQGAR